MYTKPTQYEGLVRCVQTTQCEGLVRCIQSTQYEGLVVSTNLLNVWVWW